MAETVVTLNANVTTGSGVATWLDASSRMHQEVIVQTQTGGSDPVSVSTANPFPVAGNVADNTADAGNSVKVGGVYQTAPPTLTNLQRGSLQLDAAGNLKINIVAGAAAGGTSSTVGAAVPGIATAMGFSDGTLLQLGHVDGAGNIKVNIAAGGVAAQTDNMSFTAGATSGLVVMGVYNDAISNLTATNAGALRVTATRQLIVAPQANVNGGWSPLHLVSAATTNATSVKASAGSIGFIQVGNSLGTLAYLKLYNKASAPAPASDAALVVQSYMIPGNTSGAGLTLPVPAGMSFTTGIGFAITAGAADNDATAVAVNQVLVNLGFI